jgi:hypothetical protein
LDELPEEPLPEPDDEPDDGELELLPSDDDGPDESLDPPPEELLPDSFEPDAAGSFFLVPSLPPSGVEPLRLSVR